MLLIRKHEFEGGRVRQRRDFLAKLPDGRLPQVREVRVSANPSRYRIFYVPFKDFRRGARRVL